MLSVITDALEEMGLLERLAGALEAVGAAVTTIADTLSATEKCTERTLSNFVRSRGYPQLEIFPALATSEYVSSSTSNVFQVIRHGVIFQVDGKYYYVGGVSDNWLAGRLYFYQGRAELGTQARSDLLSAMKGSPTGIVVLRVVRYSRLGSWVNPLTMGTCAGDQSNPVFNVLDQAYDALVATWENQFRGGLVFSYMPRLITEAIIDPMIAKVPGVEITLEPSSGKLNTINLRPFLQGMSALPPLPYAIAIFSAYQLVLGVLNLPQLSTIIPQVGAGIVLLSNPSVNICNEYFSSAGFPCGTLLNKPQQIGLGSDVWQALIGSPIFASDACPPRGCSSPGLYGLVSRIGGVQDINVGNVAEVAYVQLPRVINSQTLRDFANNIGALSAFEMSERRVNSAERAMAELVSVLGLTPLVASAIINVVTWYDDWRQTYEEAKKYAEVVKNVEQKIRDYLNSIKEYRLLSYVDSCIAQAIDALGENATNEQELYELALNCVFEHRPAFGPAITE